MRASIFSRHSLGAAGFAAALAFSASAFAGAPVSPSDPPVADSPPPPVLVAPALAPPSFAPPRFNLSYSWPPPPATRQSAVEAGLPLDYHDGDAIPAGYSVQRSPMRKWPFIVGGSTFGAAWLLSALTGAVARLQSGDGGWGYMVVPGVGPFVAMSEAKSSVTSDGEKGYLVALGCFQLAGLLTMVVAPFQPRKAALVWTGIAPLASPTMAGAGLSGAF